MNYPGRSFWSPDTVGTGWKDPEQSPYSGVFPDALPPIANYDLFKIRRIEFIYMLQQGSEVIVLP
ncbi:unnamed protein product, partial [Rotaria socialis]